MSQTSRSYCHLAAADASRTAALRSITISETTRRLHLPESELLWRAGRGFVVRKALARLWHEPFVRGILVRIEFVQTQVFAMPVHETQVAPASMPR